MAGAWRGGEGVRRGHWVSPSSTYWSYHRITSSFSSSFSSLPLSLPNRHAALPHTNGLSQRAGPLMKSRFATSPLSRLVIKTYKSVLSFSTHPKLQHRTHWLQLYLLLRDITCVFVCAFEHARTLAACVLIHGSFNFHGWAWSQQAGWTI